MTQWESASLTSWKSWVQIPLPLPYYLFIGGACYGIGEAKLHKRKFHIEDCTGNKYKLKVKWGPFWYYIRDGFRIRVFDDFSTVVTYLNKIRN
jgi:hypothetical protein